MANHLRNLLVFAEKQRDMLEHVKNVGGIKKDLLQKQV